MIKQHAKRVLSLFLSLVMIIGSLQSSLLQAAMLPSEHFIDIEEYSAVDQQQLLDLLQRDEVKTALLEQGVSIEQAEQRIASLTDAEIAQLQAHIDEIPAGGSTFGLLATVFIVFIFTDMLCATNIFSFVRCINK